MKNKTNKTLWGTGIITAIAASLCCITPVLALVAGTTGIASSFSWMEPLRPYLIGLTLVVLGFAWYQKLKKRSSDEITCDCETGTKTSFTQSKTFLGLITLFAILMMAFPYYSNAFYPTHKKVAVYGKTQDVKTVEFNIEGMSCSACNYTIQHAAMKVNGVLDAHADFKTGKATVKYDDSKTTINKVVQSIEKTNYKVKGERSVH